MSGLRHQHDIRKGNVHEYLRHLLWHCPRIRSNLKWVNENAKWLTVQRVINLILNQFRTMCASKYKFNRNNFLIDHFIILKITVEKNRFSRGGDIQFDIFHSKFSVFIFLSLTLILSFAEFPLVTSNSNNKTEIKANISKDEENI